MSQFSTDGRPGYIRTCNLQKFDPNNGKLMWSRYIRPPFWPPLRFNPNGYVRGAEAMNVEPIHGTNDVIVRLQRDLGNEPPCRHAFARIESACGKVEWWLHHHVGEPGPFGLPLVPPTGITSSSATSPGFTSVTALAASGADYNNVLYNISAAGVLTGSSETGFALQSPYVEHAIPGAAVLLSYRTGDQNTPNFAFNSVIINRSVGGGTRVWLSTLTLATPLAATSSLILTAEEWFRGVNHTNDDPGGPKQQGLVLRTASATSYTDGVPPLTFYPPPQTDVVVSLMEVSSQAGSVYWRGLLAATDGTRFYVVADRVTVDVWASGAPQETYSRRLVCFDTSLVELWNIPIDPIWGIIADADGFILGRTSTGTHYNVFERRDQNGNVKWRQASFNSSEPNDMCFADDGALYVVGRSGVLSS